MAAATTEKPAERLEAPKAGEPKAKDKKEKKAEKSRRKKGEKKGGALKIVIPLVLILIIGGLTAVVVFNPLGLRDKYLSGILSRIPIVNNLVSPEEDEPQESREELEANIAGLTRQTESQALEIERLNDTVAAFTAENRRLKEFEDAQTQFKTDKEAFDRQIALGNTTAYQDYYERVNPENAERLYQEAVGTAARAKELKNWVSTFNEMDEAEAAPILENLAATDMDLVVTILNNLNAEIRGAVLGKMTPQIASRIVKMMSPAAG